jgi:HTH-type transcriptional regulator, sugar sensing transcriptional regulator
MDQLISVLSQLGLDEKQAKIYLAVLELGGSTVLPISKKSKVKRTYCYDILSSLVEKGLVSFIIKNNRRRYFAEDPKKIGDDLKNKLHSFETVLPELESLHNINPNKPRVRFYEGLAGIMSVYELALGTDHLDAISSPTVIDKYLGESYLKSYSQRLMKPKFTIRELITDKPGYYHQFYVKPQHQYRFLPQGLRLKTDMFILDNKLALISYGENLHAVVIEDSSIVDTHKALFEIIWQNSGAKTKLS